MKRVGMFYGNWGFYGISMDEPREVHKHIMKVKNLIFRIYLKNWLWKLICRIDFWCGWMNGIDFSIIFSVLSQPRCEGVSEFVFFCENSACEKLIVSIGKIDYERGIFRNDFFNLWDFFLKSSGYKFFCFIEWIFRLWSSASSVEYGCDELID